MNKLFLSIIFVILVIASCSLIQIDLYPTDVGEIFAASSLTKSSNSEKLGVLVTKGLEIIEDQSFDVIFEKWGKMKFISGQLLVEGKNKLNLFLVDTKGDVQYYFPELNVNKMWIFSEIRSIAFTDVNKDGLKDIIVIADYMTGIGAEGAIPFPVSEIYFQRDKKFITISKLTNEINNAGKNKSVGMLLKFIESKKHLLPKG